MDNSITDVGNLWVGHATNLSALTGCTVILCPDGAVGGVDQRGGSPGTRETDLLRPMHMVEKIHAVLLAGGSAFGLDAASGVMRFLEERGVGFDVGVARVPIVSGAILFDLGIGSPTDRPDASMGYLACQNAVKGEIEQGCVGAGTGATVGKIYGMDRATKSGIGTASIMLNDGIIIGAIIAVNALGNIVDPASGNIIAGVRSAPAEDRFIDALDAWRAGPTRQAFDFSAQNTVIGVVATNASLTKEGANFVAQMAQDGLAQVIRPAHTLFDGDTIFALSTGDLKADISIVGAFAAEAAAAAILNAVRAAQPMGGLPNWNCNHI